MVGTHGQRELPGNVSQAFHLFKTPQTLGVPSKMLYFPDDAPCQGKPFNSHIFYKTINDCGDEWTKK
jgi:hypothetical protein